LLKTEVEIVLHIWKTCQLCRQRYTSSANVHSTSSTAVF